MGGDGAISAEELAKTLEGIRPKYAYEMLLLEISLHAGGQPLVHSTTETITQLTELYMKAVQVLEDKHSKGFEYFNWKIKTLLQKRSVIQELLKEAQSSEEERKITMRAIKDVQMKQRREQHDIKMDLQSPTANRHKVRELIHNAELRLNIIQSRIKTGIVEQETNLASRIKLRKLKSQSSTKDALEKLQMVEEGLGLNAEERGVGFRKGGKQVGQGLGKKRRNRALFSSFGGI